MAKKKPKVPQSKDKFHFTGKSEIQLVEFVVSSPPFEEKKSSDFIRKRWSAEYDKFRLA